MPDEYYWFEDGYLLTTEDGERLLMNSGPETMQMVIGTEYTVSDLPAGTCEPSELLQLAADHSWIGSGLVAIGDQPAINATLKLNAKVDSRPVSRIALASRPDQWAWRVTGWTLNLSTSDHTPQIVQLALSGGGPLCLQAQLTNQADSQVKTITISAQVVIIPADSQEHLSDRQGFTQQQLVGQVIGLPSISQEVKA